MGTFTVKVKFFSQVLDPENSEKGFVKTKIEKEVVFKELDTTDTSQHKLHFLLAAVFESFGITKDDAGEVTKLKIDSDGMYDLVVKFFNVMYVSGLDEAEKKEFLLDSAALLSLGYKLLGDQLAPFFSILIAE